MRVKIDKFRTKRTNKKRMTEAQVRRFNAKRNKYAIQTMWAESGAKNESVYN